MTADTSAVVAAVSAWHQQHDVANDALADVRSLPAHAITEAYSVLTRLPSGLAFEPPTAFRLLTERFPGPPLVIDDEDRRTTLHRLVIADVAAGSTYDGLVGLEAAANDEVLLTRDRRAAGTYRRLGVRFELLA